MKNKVLMGLVILVLLASIIMVGCAKTTPAPAPAPATTPVPTPTAVTPAVIKIGHIRPLTGFLAYQSKMMVNAFDFAFKQVGYQVAGKQIQIIVGDTQGQAELAIDVSKKMVQNDKVDLIVGPMTGPESLAVANYMSQAGIPHLLSVPSTEATLDPKLKWTLSLGGIPAQFSSAMGAYAYEQAGFRKIDVMTGDWIDGREFLNAFMAKFKADGGQIVQELYTPEPSVDYAAYLTVLKDADAVVSWYPGGEAITFLSQYHQLGIDKKMPLIAAFNGAFVAPFVLQALQPAEAEATRGVLLPTSYTSLLDNPLNKKFVADYQAAFGFPPDDTIAGAYVAGLAVIQALKATGGDASPAKLYQTLLSISLDTPQGSVKMDPQSRGCIHDMYVCKVGKQGDNWVWEPVYTYKDVPALGLK